jgi:hypothetical protein
MLEATYICQTAGCFYFILFCKKHHTHIFTSKKHQNQLKISKTSKKRLVGTSLFFFSLAPLVFQSVFVVFLNTRVIFLCLVKEGSEAEVEEEEEESDDEFFDRTTAPVAKWEALAGSRAVWVQLCQQLRLDQGSLG